MKIQNIHKFKLPNNRKIKGLNWLLNRITMILENIVIRCNSIKGCIGESSENKEVILSMTTYPARNKVVKWTIKSLLNQNVKVDRFILWLSKEQYPNQEIPQEIKQYIKYGLEVRFCDDLRSHKKYYYSMFENPHAIIITCDDDVIYPENTVEKLLIGYKKYPNAVICNQARWIEGNGNKLGPYKNWSVKLPKDVNRPNFRILPIGEGGILYPPGVLHEDVFSKKLIFMLAESVDDLWLKTMAVKKGTPAMFSEKHQRGLSEVIVLKNKSKSLHECNVEGGNNDQAIKKITEFYPELVNCIVRSD